MQEKQAIMNQEQMKIFLKNKVRNRPVYFYLHGFLFSYYICGKI